MYTCLLKKKLKVKKIIACCSQFETYKKLNDISLRILHFTKKNEPSLLQKWKNISFIVKIQWICYLFSCGHRNYLRLHDFNSYIDYNIMKWHGSISFVIVNGLPPTNILFVLKTPLLLCCKCISPLQYLQIKSARLDNVDQFA